MKNIRHPEPRRQIAEDVQSAARELAAADPWSHLPGTERKLLQVYGALASKHGERVGQPGVSWAADGEIAASLGVSTSTVRRARRALAAANGHAAFIEVRYVPAFHALPDGHSSLHGVNVVKLLSTNVPRAAQTAGAPATSGNPGGRPNPGGHMETVDKNDSGVQERRIIDAKIAEAIATSQERMAAYFEELYGPRIRRLELSNAALVAKVEALTARLETLERAEESAENGEGSRRSAAKRQRVAFTHLKMVWDADRALQASSTRGGN